MSPAMNKSAPYAALVGFSFLWCLLLVAPPFIGLVEGHGTVLSSLIYQFFSPICHQLDSHSLHLFGTKFAVCARCFGIYAGFLAGAVSVLFRAGNISRRTLIIWAVAGAPMLIDVLLDIGGIHESTLLTRLFTGLFFGILAGRILTPLFGEGISDVLNRSSIFQGTIDEPKT